MADAPRGYTKKADVKVSSDLQAVWKASAEASAKPIATGRGVWLFVACAVVIAVALPSGWVYSSYRKVEDKRSAEDAAEALNPHKAEPPQSVPIVSIRDPGNCEMLATIGAGVLTAKQGGHTLETVLATAVMPGQPEKTGMAQGVAMAIYGDRSITSPAMARAAVMKACSR